MQPIHVAFADPRQPAPQERPRRSGARDEALHAALAPVAAALRQGVCGGRDLYEACLCADVLQSAKNVLGLLRLRRDAVERGLVVRLAQALVDAEQTGRLDAEQAHDRRAA